jgi:hypothetical protein
MARPRTWYVVDTMSRYTAAPEAEMGRKHARYIERAVTSTSGPAGSDGAIR